VRRPNIPATRKADFDEVLRHAHLSTAFFTSSKDAVLVGFRHTSTARRHKAAGKQEERGCEHFEVDSHVFKKGIRALMPSEFSFRKHQSDPQARCPLQHKKGSSP
jgi:hypothetical protein